MYEVKKERNKKMKKYLLSGYDVENLEFYISNEIHETLEEARKSVFSEIDKNDNGFYDEVYHLGISDKVEFLITEI